jgi:hypothetical protein
VLKAALEKDLAWLTDIVLENSVITPELISLLARTAHNNELVDMLDKPKRPKFLSNVQTVKKSKRGLLGAVNGKPILEIADEPLRFVDIIASLVEKGHKSHEIIQLISLMQNKVEMARPKPDDVDSTDETMYIQDDLDYRELFAIFLVRRKLTLLRYLFTLDEKDFKFDYELFLKSLELEAYDMAALLYKEFFRLFRDVASLEQAITSVISSFSKNNGMLDYKCYLVRQFTEKMQLRHAKMFLDNVQLKVKNQSK